MELAAVHHHFLAGDGDETAELLPLPFRGIDHIASGVRGECLVAVIELNGRVGAIDQRFKDRAPALCDFADLSLVLHAGEQGVVVGNGIRKLLGAVAKGSSNEKTDVCGHCVYSLWGLVEASRGQPFCQFIAQALDRDVFGCGLAAYRLAGV